MFLKFEILVFQEKEERRLNELRAARRRIKDKRIRSERRRDRNNPDW